METVSSGLEGVTWRWARPVALGLEQVGPWIFHPSDGMEGWPCGHGPNVRDGDDSRPFGGQKDVNKTLRLIKACLVLGRLLVNL